MKRWIRLAAAFYPQSWLEEFGEEFGALLDDVPPRWRVFSNVLGGAVKMQITTGNNWLILVGVMAALGVIVAGAMNFRVPPRYVSSVTISVTPQADTVRPTSPEALRQRAAENVAEIETTVLSRATLSAIIHNPGLQLYRAELQRMPLQDVVEQMRNDIQIQLRPSSDSDLAPIVLNISFSYPDQIQAQATVHALADKFADVSGAANIHRAEAYVGFWRDMTAVDHKVPAPPPPPVGEMVRVLDSASIPTQSSGPNRIVFLAWGLAAGLLLGLLAALALRWPRAALQLGGFAVAGCVLAAAASFLIPDRYISTAVMMIAPASVTEDPMAPLPAPTPVADFLREMEPQLLSQRLSRLIQEPRLNLYPEQRATKSMEEVVRNIVANDLHITPLSAIPGAVAPASAFSISLSYPDRYKAQAAVQELMNDFDDLNQIKNKERSNTANTNATLRQIYARKAGENLEVLDVASLPVAPVFPNRLVIAASGLGIGLLLCVVRLGFRRPRTPVPQSLTAPPFSTRDPGQPSGTAGGLLFAGRS